MMGLDLIELSFDGGVLRITIDSGRWIKIRCSDRFYRGILAGIEGEDVIVNIEGSEVRIPLQAIVKANLDFEFRE